MTVTSDAPVVAPAAPVPPAVPLRPGEWATLACVAALLMLAVPKVAA
jgi:hypothetical protein